MAIEVQPSLSPHLCVDGAAAAIDFYVKAFNAVELGRVPGPDGKLVHAALQINGSTVLLNDDFPEYNDGKSSTPTALGGTPVTIHQTVADVDAERPSSGTAWSAGAPPLSGGLTSLCDATGNADPTVAAGRGPSRGLLAPRRLSGSVRGA